jgi:hypothetical protein
MKHLTSIILSLGVLVFGASTAHAQITLDLLPLNPTGTIGDTIAFRGTVTNGSNEAVYLTGNDSVISGGLSIDDSKFWTHAGLILSPGATTGMIDLFDVKIGSSTLPGLYGGTFTIIGGADAAAQDNIATQGFNVNVVPPAQVPEPEALTASAAGAVALLAVFALRLRKKVQ